MRIEEGNQEIFALLYVPALTGNKIKIDTTIQVSPGAIMEVRVELIHDDNTPSGYLWTTLNGSDEKNFGDSC